MQFKLSDLIWVPFSVVILCFAVVVGVGLRVWFELSKLAGGKEL